MTNKLLDNFKKSLNNKNKVLVGLSGGADSVALLILSINLLGSDNVRAIHINHNMQDASIEFENFCKNLCNKLNVNLIIKSGYCSEFGTDNEENARKLRRKFYSEQILDQEVLLLGHHLNDQAETFIFRAIRGSHTLGLSAMQAEGFFNNVHYLRPFLNCKKSLIIDFLNSINQNWIEDPSNSSIEYSRNAIRSITPILEKAHPNALNGLAKSANACKSATKLLEILAKEDLLKINKDLYLDFSSFPSILEDNDRLLNCLTYYFKINNLNLSENILLKTSNAILESINNNTREFVANISDDIKIICKNKFLTCIDNRLDYTKNPQNWILSNIDNASWISYSKNIKYNKFNSLDEYFRKNNIPPSLRKFYPYLIDSNNQLIYTPLLNINADKYKDSAKTSICSVNSKKLKI